MADVRLALLGCVIPVGDMCNGSCSAGLLGDYFTE
jgi:hypothetical protein